MRTLLTLVFVFLAQFANGQKKSVYQRDEMLFEKGLLLQHIVDEDLKYQGPLTKDSLWEEV